jgi:hypothetical protein
VLNQLNLDLVDEDEEVREATDRAYRERKGSEKTLAIVDEALAILRTIDPTPELKFNKFYVGLARNGEPDNLVVFRPNKDRLTVEPRLPRAQETRERLEPPAST